MTFRNAVTLAIQLAVIIAFYLLLSPPTSELVSAPGIIGMVSGSSLSVIEDEYRSPDRREWPEWVLVPAGLLLALVVGWLVVMSRSVIPLYLCLVGYILVESSWQVLAIVPRGGAENS